MMCTDGQFPIWFFLGLCRVVNCIFNVQSCLFWVCTGLSIDDSWHTWHSIIAELRHEPARSWRISTRAQWTTDNCKVTLQLVTSDDICEAGIVEQD